MVQARISTQSADGKCISAVLTWESGPRDGVTTRNVEHYMDLAGRYDFDGVLGEGWNLGWDGDWTEHGDRFSFTRSYPDFDMDR